MAVLTGLAPDPYRPGYRLVEVDRGRFASLAGEALASLPLAVGEPIAPAVMARLHALADAEAALRAAMRMLALRSHARAELRRRLVRRQHPPAAVDEAIAILVARGLLDDRVSCRALCCRPGPLRVFPACIPSPRPPRRRYPLRRFTQTVSPP